MHLVQSSDSKIMAEFGSAQGEDMFYDSEPEQALDDSLAMARVPQQKGAKKEAPSGERRVLR